MTTFRRDDLVTHRNRPHLINIRIVDIHNEGGLALASYYNTHLKRYGTRYFLTECLSLVEREEEGDPLAELFVTCLTL